MKLSTKRRALLVNGVLAVLLVAGAGVAYASLNGESQEPTTTGQVTRVTRGTVLATVSASGAVESAKTRALGFGTGGTVEKIYVEPGDQVKKGQVLARLDDTAARESLDAAKASLDAAEDGDTDTAAGYAEYISARNAYREARRALAGTVLKAPFAGTVTAVNGTVGGSSSGSSSSSASSSGSSGTSGSSGGGGSGGGGAGASGSSGSSGSGGSGGFIELADPNKLQIVGDFTEADVTRLKPGQAATFTFDALTGVTAQGKVSLIDPVARTSNNVVQYAVTISMTEVPDQVRLGQTTTVQVVVDQAEDVLAVPTSAVTTAGGQSTVTVLENGVETPRRVEIGVKGDTLTEIKSGLNEGDQVVRRLTQTNGSQGGGFPGLGGGGAGLRGGTGGIRVPAGGAGVFGGGGR
ncbi:HlyD family efflux transporter periplasmic adaptor subunit [Thermopolyspora sp. NPDC052614]|uniref:efflux RND transporter periplasmic adaptor subunit n=1 Tax=Thermopolyspora sp. NPDC052614 TaxID=3155682 RepID=UPI0034372BA7